MLRKKSVEDMEVGKKNIVLRIEIDSSFTEEKGFLEPEKIVRYQEVLRFFSDKKAKVVALFEMGKNRVKYPAKVSVETIINPLSELLGMELNYFTGGSDKDMEYALEELLPGEILFWENLALSGEEDKDSSPVFEKLQQWGDFFVNDAFEVSSREYYSFKKMPDKLEAYAGIHLMREIKGLAELISKLERPLTIVMGGLNIDSFMIDQLLTLSDKADDILLTGAWVAHYAKELGEIEKEDWMDRKPSKVFEKNFNKIAKRENIHFPVDVKVYKKYKDGSQKTANVPIDFIKKGLKIGDIGLETIERYAQILKDSKLIIWLGSVGKWWKEGMQEGTLALAGSISRVYSDKIVIGDDLIESLLNLNFDDFHRFSHIHYGDGETIFNFLLQGKVLGVEKLKNAWNI